jgi:hypothetical protein
MDQGTDGVGKRMLGGITSMPVPVTVSVERPMPAERPAALPHCPYPTVADIHRHGIQPLPAVLPVVDFSRAKAYRSLQYTTMTAATLTATQAVELARVVSTSFARREPQARHIQPPSHRPRELVVARHSDPFGREAFGPWSTASLLYWFIRLCVLTDPASPRDAITVNRETLAQSLAIVNEHGRVIGGALNETMPHGEAAPKFREDDPFLSAALGFVAPVLALLGTQDAEALAALSKHYPRFAQALSAGRVGHHFMGARSDALDKADAFELVAATAARYQELGYVFMVVEATNQWTGAACEVLNGVRVHFAPFLARPAVRKSAVPLENAVTSPSGFLSAKDSGSMFYVIRLS